MTAFDILYLHVGTPKTGTTALQNVLSENADQLRIKGVYVAPTISNRTRHLQLFRNDPGPKILELTSGNFDRSQDSADGLEAYLAYTAEHGKGCDTLVMSEETISNFDIPELQRMQESLARYCKEIKIIITFREPREYLKSNYYQRIRGTESTLDIREFRSLVAHQLNYEFILEKFEDTFGRDAIIPFVYEQNIVRGIAACFGLHVEEAARKNVTPGRDLDIYVKAMLNLMTRNREIPSIRQNARLAIATKIADLMSEIDVLSGVMEDAQQDEYMNQLLRIECRNWEAFRSRLRSPS